MEPYLAGTVGLFSTVLFGLAIWQFRAQRSDNIQIMSSLAAHGEKMVRIETILTGATGNNGLVSRVEDLHNRRNDEQARVFTLAAEAIIELREERRSGVTDRRSA